MDGGTLIAEVLRKQGVRFLFTLCGGHISPILVGATRADIRVIDVRHEVNAVFAADAVARLTGVPGVAAVTAGPGLTNTITAVKNAQLAQSPVIILGGATATVLKGRGALQDIDQLALMRPHVKWAVSVTKVRDLVPVLERAFAVALSDVPGPVFVECPVDLLYAPEIVKSWYSAKSRGDRSPSLQERALAAYLDIHTWRMFAGASSVRVGPARIVAPPQPPPEEVRAAAKALRAHPEVNAYWDGTTVVRRGNVIFLPQPDRARTQDLDALYLQMQDEKKRRNTAVEDLEKLHKELTVAKF